MVAGLSWSSGSPSNNQDIVLLRMNTIREGNPVSRVSREVNTGRRTLVQKTSALGAKKDLQFTIDCTSVQPL